MHPFVHRFSFQQGPLLCVQPSFQRHLLLHDQIPTMLEIDRVLIICDPSAYNRLILFLLDKELMTLRVCTTLHLFSFLKPLQLERMCRLLHICLYAILFYQSCVPFLIKLTLLLY
jgi:hypothetical protein